MSVNAYSRGERDVLPGRRTAKGRDGKVTQERTELTSVDREGAVVFLKRRLEPADIRQVLNEGSTGRRTRKTVEWIVAETESSGPRLRSRLDNEDLYALLVDLRGVDLLISQELRLQIARRASPDELQALHDYPSGTRGRGGRESVAKAIAYRRWVPGRSWPLHFVRTLGLPTIFAGVEGSATPPESEEVAPFVPLPDLKDFQLELKDQVLGILRGEARANRGILSLPTGAGKTRTAVEALVEWRLGSEERPAILWIAQSEELCEQAVQAFKEVWVDLGHRGQVRETLPIHRLWGGGREVPVNPGAVIASIQKLHAIYRGDDVDARREDLETLAGLLGAVTVDEAHRILAPSYSDVLGFLGADVVRGRSSPIPLLGLTATPFRANEDETRHLVARFHGRLLHPLSLGDDPVAVLRERQVLSRPVHQVLDYSGQIISIEDNAQYRSYYERFSDFHPALLRHLGEERSRNQKLIEHLCAMPPDWPVLFFGCSVEHAQAVEVLLKRRNRTAATVTSLTRPSTRRFLVNEFRHGRISVLCNFGVLTTGFDAPQVRAVVVSRPTASQVLYEQMIGRGMRGPEFGGTSECLVIDVADNIQFGGQMAFRRYAEYWTAEQKAG